MNKLSCKVRAKLRKEGWTISDFTRPKLPSPTEVETVLRCHVERFLRGEIASESAPVYDWRWRMQEGEPSPYDIIAWRICE